MKTYKVVSRHPYTKRQDKKKVYVTQAKYDKHAPELIKSWNTGFDIEVYQMDENEKWQLISKSPYDGTDRYYKKHYERYELEK